MVYEKKMLILSGEGKGVVLIEKSARGLRFSLSTFDMPVCGELKAGVITPKSVYVRDLPQRDNPSSVFIVDGENTDNLHFAVFDTKLRLYGTNGKRMWEANIMDLLCKNDRKAPPPDDGPVLAALPPISTPPEVLPMPDGTGLPQSRLEIYGDEAIAESNFYTPLDLSAHMPTVDRFLDAPRVLNMPEILDGLAPKIVKASEPSAETTAILGAQEVREMQEDADMSNAEQTVGDTAIDGEPSVQTVEQSDEEDVSGAMPAAAATADSVHVSEAADGAAAATTAAESETAVAGSFAYSGARPCEMEARWLKTRSTRTIKSEKGGTVKPITSGDKVKPIREMTFIEHAAADIEKLFGNAEKDEKLSSVLPDIEWIKVPIDNHVISVGRGGSDFLCYAVSGTYEKTSPLGEEAQWLPENKSIPTGKGYWLIFQSLKDGKIISN